MRRFPEFNPRWALNRTQTFTAVGELNGLVQAGMKTEALRLARRLLKARAIPAPVFGEALDAILTLADRIKMWKPLIEAAYERVPRRDRGAVRFWMMSLCNCCQDHEGVLRQMPKRFTGEFALIELIYSIEATFSTGNAKLMRRLAARVPRFIDQANHPIEQAQLLLCLAEFHAREGNWDQAIDMAELIFRCETLHKDAVAITVEIHVARALLTLRRGFDRVEEFNRSFDSTSELKLPGNDKVVQEQAAKEFRRLQKLLEKVLPKERQKELGLQ